jgi:hypothetical protein
MEYTTDIVLGQRYRDEQTGIEGVATAITFHQYACERVLIEYVHPQKGLEELGFDAPRLTHIESGQRATTEKTGGPEHSLRGSDAHMRRSGR